MRDTYDVVVVGGGGSGLAAAVSAAEHGLSVLLLEKQPQIGGTTGIAVGSFTANGTRMQQKRSIADNPGDHNVDAGKFAAPGIEARNNFALRGFFLSHAAQTLHWLMDKGLTFHGPSPEPPNRVPRMHNVVPNAKAYIATLQAELLRRGGLIICNAGVTKINKTAGKVTGVTARIDGHDRIIHASRGVVLAAGDYANNPAIIARYKGDRFSVVEGINPHATGDGHTLAEAAGAKMLNMDVTYGPELRFVAPKTKSFAQLLPSSGVMARVMGMLMPMVPRFVIHAMIKRLLVTWQHPENALFDDGAILLNAQGNRFCDEKVWPDREIAVAQQSDKITYILLDARLIERYSAWPHFISTAPKIAYAYVDDYLKLRPDVAVRADSLTELASMRGFDGEALKKTAEAAGLRGSRWVLLGPCKAYFTTTEGGAAINESLAVLDESANVIEGLYAVGQTGLGGQVLWGHGLHIAWAMTSGRLVGKVLAGKA